MPTDAATPPEGRGVAKRRDWRSRKEAADDLGVSLDTIDRWIEMGRIQALQPGGPGTHVRVLVSEIERVMCREKGAA